MILKLKIAILNILSKIRAPVVRTFKPITKLRLFVTPLNPLLKPVSNKFGYDRGTPIDRFYIDKFLDTQKDNIKGICLEIHDSKYTKKYGGKNVTKADVLDIDTNNKLATIYDDLRDLKSIPTESYDCLIITHTISVIDDFQASINECHRILKSGGILLCTLPAIGVALYLDQSFWRFTVSSAKYSFGKVFNPQKIEVGAMGNIRSGQGFWVGMSAEEFTIEELSFNDPRFAVIITVKATK